MGEKLGSNHMQPLVMMSSFPPRLCGIGTFAEEALEFIHKAIPDRPIAVVTHTDCVDGTHSEYALHPVIDMSRADWHVPVAEKLHELNPYAVHIEHEYGLYNYVDEHGNGDFNAGFLKLLDAIRDLPVIIEPHTVHGRMFPEELEFIQRVAERCNVLLFKCDYQKWRLEWVLAQQSAPIPQNITIVPHGARPDRRYDPYRIDQIKEELGLGDLIGKRLAGLVGWIQNNKRWDIATNVWPEVAELIKIQTGEEWCLFAAGAMRDPNHLQDFEYYVSELRRLEEAGLARFYEFIPRGERYYKVMALCDFVILPTLDETQSGTLARIIALNKPYITTAPLEGLTAQTVESEGGLLFTNRETLKRRILRLATNEELRWHLGEKLKRYLNTRVSWHLIAQKYVKCYELARESCREKVIVRCPSEFSSDGSAQCALPMDSVV
ncbi:MAG: hypothetical protein JXQ73_17565 [Phycisphaerae bacterium]|nr:hypothetical protein [Phycisphaerae bacterium]